MELLWLLFIDQYSFGLASIEAGISPEGTSLPPQMRIRHIRRKRQINENFQILQLEGLLLKGRLKRKTHFIYPQDL